MFKTIAKILAVIVLASTLAIFWHALSMEQGMTDMDGMSAPCLSVCVAAGNAAVEIAPFALVPIVAILLFLIANLVLSILLLGHNSVGNDFQKDRHRYLMKTAVMLR